MAELDSLIGQRIAEARLEAGLTQEQLAEAAGIAPENLSRAERGRTILRTRKLIAIADTLGVSLDDLARGREVIPTKGAAVARLIKRVERFDESTARNASRVLNVFVEAVKKERGAQGHARSMVLSPDFEEEENAEDRAIEVTSSIVSDVEAEPALDELFKRRPGSWVDVSKLCGEIEELDEALRDLRDEDGVGLRVTWLKTPTRSGKADEAYCVIIFYSPELNWIVNIAVFDKGSFDER